MTIIKLASAAFLAVASASQAGRHRDTRRETNYGRDTYHAQSYIIPAQPYSAPAQTYANPTPYVVAASGYAPAWAAPHIRSGYDGYDASAVRYNYDHSKPSKYGSSKGKDGYHGRDGKNGKNGKNGKDASDHCKRCEWYQFSKASSTNELFCPDSDQVVSGGGCKFTTPGTSTISQPFEQKDDNVDIDDNTGGQYAAWRCEASDSQVIVTSVYCCSCD